LSLIIRELDLFSGSNQLGAFLYAVNFEAKQSRGDQEAKNRNWQREVLQQGCGNFFCCYKYSGACWQKTKQRGPKFINVTVALA